MKKRGCSGSGSKYLRNRPGLDLGMITPDFLEQFGTRHDAIGLRRQYFEKTSLQRGQLHLSSGPRSRQLVEVYSEAGDVDHPLRLCALRIPTTPLQHAADAQQKFAQVKWLDQIIIGAQLQSVNPVGFGCAGGEHQYGKFLIMLAHPAGNLESVHFFDHDVQDNQVEALAEHPLERLFAARRSPNAVPLLLQVEVKRTSEIDLIFNQKDQGPVFLGCSDHGILTRDFPPQREGSFGGRFPSIGEPAASSG
jgi:hypothetical protein